MNLLINHYCFLLIFLLHNVSYAQVKYEREIRVEREEVPNNAIEFVDACEFPTKIKWHKELGLTSTSFEAKTRWEGNKYSIEFFEDGTFEDLEVEVKQERIPPVSFNEFNSYLDSVHTSYGIKKIQIQYSGSQRAVHDYIVSGKISDTLAKRYEIVISAKVERTYKLFEYLFSESGEFISKSQITLSPTDNIEY